LVSRAEQQCGKRAKNSRYLKEKLLKFQANHRFFHIPRKKTFDILSFLPFQITSYLLFLFVKKKRFIPKKNCEAFAKPSVLSCQKNKPS